MRGKRYQIKPAYRGTDLPYSVRRTREFRCRAASRNELHSESLTVRRCYGRYVSASLSYPRTLVVYCTSRLDQSAHNFRALQPIKSALAFRLSLDEVTQKYPESSRMTWKWWNFLALALCSNKISSSQYVRPFGSGSLKQAQTRQRKQNVA